MARLFLRFFWVNFCRARFGEAPIKTRSCSRRLAFCQTPVKRSAPATDARQCVHKRLKNLADIVGRLTRSLPLTRPSACPSMSLGARRPLSLNRHSFGLGAE